MEGGGGAPAAPVPEAQAASILPEDMAGAEDWGPPPTFPRLRVVMGLIGGLTLAAFVYHSLTAASRWRQQKELREREDRFVGFLHREEANTRLVNGDVEGAIEHYTEAAQLALCGSEPEADDEHQQMPQRPPMSGADQEEGHHRSVDPAYATPDLEFSGTEGWALALIQRAAAYWSAADVESCARDTLAVLRVYSRNAAIEEVTSKAVVSTTDNGAGALGAGDGSAADAEGVTKEVKASEEDEEKKKKEAEEVAKLERQHKDRQNRIRARAAELLARCLSAKQGQEPWAALVALNLCINARPGARPGAIVQLEHLRDSLQKMLALDSERTSSLPDEPVRYPVRIAAQEDEFKGLLVATEAIAEGSDILFEAPFLVAPWPQEGATRRVRGPLCQAAEWLLHDYVLSSLPDVIADGKLPASASAEDAGSEEDRCLFLLAKRVFACLAIGHGQDLLQPLWDAVIALIKSFPAQSAGVEDSAQAQERSEQEWRSLAEVMRKQGDDVKESAIPTLEEWNSLVAQLRRSAIRIVRPAPDHTAEDSSFPGVVRGLGLYLIGSHAGRSSTQPNARVSFDEARAALRLVALRSIAPGEPITVLP